MKHVIANPLITLVQTLNDGIAVYKSAISKMEHDDCKELFCELIACREFALDYLQPYIVMQNGAPELGHGFGTVIHHTYSQVQNNNNDDHDMSLLKQLEQVEDETLKAMEITAKTSANALVNCIIRDLIPRMRACRAQVLGLEAKLAA
ncbi:MAG: hypothetical protein RL497_187 [Pseudomonadota bacterium]|jgi:uncharacterized protein (TIGR02284 family)